MPNIKRLVFNLAIVAAVSATVMLAGCAGAFGHPEQPLSEDMQDVARKLPR